MAADFVSALVLLVLTAPIMLLAAALVKLTSRGPALYKQVRLGLDGRPFEIYKIRTMHADCERQSGPQWSRPGDKRVTPVGRLLRATHIDELPQLWNILRGEMSLVGPRPERPVFVAQLVKSLPDYPRRMSVRPGVTGLAQVQLGPDSDLGGVRRKLACDLYYVDHADLWLDLRIVLSTTIRLAGLPSARFSRLLGVPAIVRIETERQEYLPEVVIQGQVNPAGA